MEQDALWDYTQTEGVEAFRGAGPRLGWLVRQIPRGKSVLNIGVGDGAFELYALRRGLLVCSLDPSAAAITKLQQKYGSNVDARAGRAEAMPWGAATMDTVVMTEVLEHLDDQVLSATLAEVRRVLKPGGAFLGTVPSHEDLRVNNVVCPNCTQVFHRWGHVRSFSASSLRRTLASEFSSVSVEDRFFTPWADLGPQGVAALLSRSDPQGIPPASVRRWLGQNWRALLSSGPRLLARQVGVRFDSNLAFRASNPR